MNCVLKLQTLQLATNTTKQDVIFMSGISILCPITAAGNSAFEME